ncbi:MAG: ATP-binding protein [Nostoc sp. EfeVER01]|uniref:ATP-binding protein n=1 Tax=Nostoc sp. EfeVER01 TaxID=3075406 RepID=UPI002AD44149|nr:ATP-binding protein [Nostoc sp. EfeVER01]MDZ7943670.1 ATP-binding protein [Nostoc sp. EfeVER01]
MIDLQSLRQVSLFAQLNDQDLHWLAEHGSDLWLEPGKKFPKEGERADYFYVLLEGKLRITKNFGGHEMYLATYEPGTPFGEVPLFTNKPYLASACALQESHLFRLNKDAFWEMLTNLPSITRNLLNIMGERMQVLESTSQQREKLVALGTLAAGLAHEMNNPAAASCRAAEQLQETLERLSSFALKLSQQPITKEQMAYIVNLQHHTIKRATPAPYIDSLTQSDLENEVADWLKTHSVDDVWKLTPALVQAGLNTEWLDTFVEHVTADLLSDALKWLEATLTGVELLNEIEQSTTRISKLIKAVKDYSYMDQAPLQQVDVHEGLQSTLAILGYKLKRSVVVTRQYDLSLPRIYAYGSQLNQVWTNLIDNAINAIQGNGQIWIRTSRENDSLLVEITDNGAGIPPEIHSRIFEPFFTTKGVGEGTGLGLHIAYRIVVTHHQGDISFISQPGCTCFQVRLPIEQSH